MARPRKKADALKTDEALRKLFPEEVRKEARKTARQSQKKSTKDQSK